MDDGAVGFCVGELLVGNLECFAFGHGGANDTKMSVARWDDGWLYARAQLSELIEELTFVQVGDEHIHVFGMVSVCFVLYIYGIAPDIFATVVGYYLETDTFSDLFQFGKEAFAVEWRITEG